MATSAFHGRIEEIPGISVDNFEKCESRAYFLTHCHFDHTYGLYEDSFLTYLLKKKYYVYTSTHTAMIISHRKPTLKSRIKQLRLGLEIILIPGDEERAIDEKYISVTLIPAGHCFGSVMYLFETMDKTVLFTGDFRIFEDDVCKFTDLHDKNGEVIPIDTLYVDTEFQSEDYPDFPLRSESVQYAIQEMKKWLRKSEKRYIALHVSAEFGYEYIFNEIYKELGIKVHVNENSWQFYSQVPHLVPGVTNDSNTRIHLCNNRFESESHDECIKNDKEVSTSKDDKNKKVFLYMHFSAMKWKNYMEGTKMFCDDYVANRIDVCYATHNSRNELFYFVNYLSAKKVVGFRDPYMGPVNATISY